MKIILLILAVFFNCYWIWYLYTKNNCKKEIRAVYVGKSKFKGGTIGEEFILVFKYNFQGTAFEEKSFETYSKGKIMNRFTEGNEYSVFVNEKKPKYFVTERKIQLYDLMTIGVGIIFIILYLIF